MTGDESTPTEYGLVMPFVTVTSKGGPHDDDSFAAGWLCANIDAQLAALHGTPFVIEQWAPPAVVPQLDLIAMKHELTLRQHETYGDGAYVRIRIGHSTMLDTPDGQGR